MGYFPKNVLKNVPYLKYLTFWGCILGLILSFIALIFQVKTASISYHFLSFTKIDFFILDQISALFLFFLFSSATLFSLPLIGRSSDRIFRIMLVNSVLIILTGDFYCFITLSGIFILLLSRFLDQENKAFLWSILPLLGVGSLFTLFYNRHLTMMDWLSPIVITSSFYLFCISIAIAVSCFSFIGLIAGYKRCVSNVTLGIREAYSEYWVYVFMAVIGFYLLSRFWLQNMAANNDILLDVCFIAGGMIGAIWAGWQCLSIQQLNQQVYSLFILGNGFLTQTIGILSILSKQNFVPWMNFGYHGLYLGIAVQIIGFSTAFLLTNLIQRRIVILPFDFPSTWLIETKRLFLCLVFLLSALPPFAGFTGLWMNLHLLFAFPNDHQLMTRLLITLLVGGDAILIFLMLLGWLSVIISVKRIVFQKNTDNASIDQNLLRSGLSIYGGFIFLLSISIFPGILFYLSNAAIEQGTHYARPESSIFFLTAFEGKARFFPWAIILIYGMVLWIYYELSKIRNVGESDQLPFGHSVNLQRDQKTIFIQSSFNFGETAFRNMLLRRLSFIVKFKDYCVKLDKHYQICKQYFLNYEEFFRERIDISKEKILLWILILGFLSTFIMV